MANKLQSAEEFVNGLAHALGRDKAHPSQFEDIFPSDEHRQCALQNQVAHRSRKTQLALFEQLVARAGAISVDVIALASLDDLAPAIAALVDELDAKSTLVSWNHPFLTDIGLSEALAEVGAEIVLPENGKTDVNAAQCQTWRRAAARAAMGITGADYCIAETATLVMRNRPGQPRSASLLPEVHAAVIGLDQIIASPAELFALMGSPAAIESPSVTNCMTWVSSNSKTGDIEGELVPGVHGPGRMVIYVITGPDYPTRPHERMHESV